MYKAVHDYPSARTYLRRGRCKRNWWRNNRPLANNTRLAYLGYGDNGEGGDIAVRFHGSCVVIYHANGTTTIDTCGWDTVTTRDRINRFAPSNVPQVEHYRGNLVIGGPIDQTPTKRIRCGECHGAWANPVMAVLTNAPKCRCGTWKYDGTSYPWTPGDGYVTVGGKPIYKTWDGGPITFDSKGRLVE